VYYKIIQSGGS